MGFKLLMLRGQRSETNVIDSIVQRLAAASDLDVEVRVAQSDADALPFLESADAAFGFVGPELFARAPRLRWLACPQAGPDPSFYHSALVASEVVVTNVRGIFSDHISAHIMAFVLGFSRGMHRYYRAQAERRWEPGVATVYLPESTAVIVGTGAIGAQTAQRCADFGMTVVGVDPRVTEAPPAVSELVAPERLMEVLPRADFVVVTVPETPQTRGQFGAEVFAAMKAGAFFINIGRGATVRLLELDRALRDGAIAGAALDVFETEPLPAEHPLWDAPGMLITPHVATVGPYLDDRRVAVFVENCRRFDRGEALLNVVDKASWF